MKIKAKVQNTVQQEPVASLGLANAVFALLTILAVPVAPWLHAVIIIAAYVVTLIATRKRVVPQ